MNLEPILAFLGLLYSVVAIFANWLTKRLGKRIKAEEMSITYALAYGYVNNYLAPVVRGLRKSLADPFSFEFIVYIPEDLSEFSTDSMDETISELANKEYVVDSVELIFDDKKRKLDYRTAKKIANDSTQYFDFPTTLLTLEKVIQYKLKTEEDKYVDSEVAELSKEYITNFNEQLHEILKNKKFSAIRDNIKIIYADRFNFLTSEKNANKT